ncbi:hypothetical protein SEUCBS140593_004017 [Sporothrix eucalyptigena]|uniref:AB hydrolase-1 domain-containing protein n=1 Tax=Sporothrix eucalyptigena TaxID=1812306 RepID=A0ABP0BKS5_9PEZI
MTVTVVETEVVTNGINGHHAVNGISAEAAAGRNPRFSLPDTTPRSSKTSMVIGGVRIYVYGLDDLPPTPAGTVISDVGVLFLAHNRTRTYRVTEGIAHELLHRYRTDGRQKNMGLIAVTMDMRNHGEREISPDANRTWSVGNERHAIDLLSLIDGGVYDFKLVMDYLPMYLPQFGRLHNVMAGVSLGGHTAWRLSTLVAPGTVAGYTMVVGCPNLTSLLVGRLGVTQEQLEGTDDDTRLDLVEYDRLEKLLDDQQKRRWPRALAEQVRQQDRQIAGSFPADTPLLLCNGAQDDLVPARYTAAWAKARGVLPTDDVIRKPTVAGQDPKPPLIDLLIQDNTGHSCTKEMVARIAVWLGDLFASP